MGLCELLLTNEKFWRFFPVSGRLMPDFGEVITANHLSSEDDCTTAKLKFISFSSSQKLPPQKA
jgi:hypothetical protein